MKRLILSLCMLVAVAVTSAAQNSIDRLVENFSSVGNSTFTSAVERDSKTHRIKKVVKKLTLEGKPSRELRKAFEDEAHTGAFTERNDNGETVLMLTTQDEKTNRVYMLCISDEKFYPKTETTIIIKVK
ncbi:MAG: DUF5024 domain-containing protein [Muribaculaceae bacterium]|nr:DUF5024 domain-containing protein [Muribaculaceae bacterium]